jgi:hypothetical protein
MRSRRYSIRLGRNPKTIRVTVYADRSVELDIVHHDHNDEVTTRQRYLQTREEAAWTLRFAHLNGTPIERTFL